MTASLICICKPKTKKTDSLSTASLAHGVQIQDELVYPLEDFFTMYLSDSTSLPIRIVTQISMIVEIVRHISMIMEIVSPATDTQRAVWYNYLYSVSNRSVILMPTAMAIISS